MKEQLLLKLLLYFTGFRLASCRYCYIYIYNFLHNIIYHIPYRKNNRNAIFLSDSLHPQTTCVIKTRASSLGLQIFQGDAQKIDFSEREYAGIVMQYPDTNGEIQDFSDTIAAAHSSGVRLFTYSLFVSTFLFTTNN